MTLYDLMNSVTVQGAFVEIVTVSENGEEIGTESFEDVDDLQYNYPEAEDMTVKYIYPRAFTRYYPSGAATCACLVVEVCKE